MGDIPLIDLRHLSKDDLERRKMACQMKKAFTSAGFAGVFNHNITDSAIEKIWNTMDNFFALPIDIKEKYSVSIYIHAVLDY